ncbi:MAG: fibronectin type III domain-containing protein, partial [Clostridiales bacterium]|nr:fibronectin type III domain-containing protein [Clostridiales bacterium]
MKKRTRSIAAVLMAVLMTVGLIPTDFTLVKAVAASEVKKVFNANDTTLTWADSKASVGDDGYFTVDANTDTSKVTMETLAEGSEVTHTVDGETLTFTKWMKFNSDNPKIEFTVSEGATAKVTVVTQANGTGKFAAIQLDDDEKHITDKVVTVTWDVAAGKHTIISQKTSTTVDESKLATGCNKSDVDDTKGRAKPKFFYIGVVETSAGGNVSTTDKIFNAVDTTLTWTNSKASVGDDGYFTVDANTDTSKVTMETLAEGSEVTHTVDGETLTFTKWMKFNSDNPKIEFTVSEGATAKVTVVTQANGTGKFAAIQLDDDEKHITDKVVTVTWDVAAGKHTIISQKTSTTVDESKLATGCNKSDVDDTKGRAKPKFFYIKVTETSGSAAVGTAPVISSATAALKTGTDDTVVISWVEGTAADGEGEVVVEAIKDGGTPSKIKLTDENKTSKSVEYTLPSSGSYTFKVYGKLGSTSNDGVTTTPAITYTRVLAAPQVTVKAGDGKADISWAAVPEVTGYKVIVKNGATEVANEDLASTAKTYAVTGLTNLTTYTCTVTAVRDAETAVSDEVSFTPYKPVDTSAAVPGMSIVNQSADNAVSISRTGGNMNFSQSATSGGLNSTKGMTDSSFVLTPEAITGPFTMTADITYDKPNSNSRGLYFGAFTGTNALDKLITLAVRGDGFNAYRTKSEHDGTYNNGGSGKTGFTAGTKYSVTFSRTEDGLFSYSASAEDEEVVSGSWVIPEGKDYPDFHTDLQGAVRVGFLISGASADVENLKITKGDGTVVFDSSTLEGEFQSFQDNWASVAAPVISVEGAKDKMVVTSNCEISQVGAGTVTVVMKDKDGKEVERQSSSKTGSSQTFEFAPEVSGKYTFTAESSRPAVSDVKTSNTVSVDNFVATLKEPQGLTATSQGSGSIKLQWNAYGEATAWKVRYKAGNGDWSEYVTIDDANTTNYTAKNLTVGTEYTFEVTTVRGDETKAATATATATADSKFRWQFSAYGSSMSTKTEDTGYEGDANEGQVTVWNLNGKGKIVPNSTDGLAFYYTQIPASSNFILKAKVHVDQWTLSNGQDGFGVMVADRVGEHGNTANFWNNSYQAIASKVEYLVNEETGEIGDTGKKISMKLGLGVTAKTGVTKENLDRLNASDTDTVQNEFKTETVPLDTSAMNLDAGTYNVIPEGKNTAVTEGLAPVQDYYITIQKNNTGYFITYSDTNGNPIKLQKYYDTNAMNMIDEEYVYAGFFASRNAKATYSDISLELRDPSDDPAPEEKPLKYVTPKYSVTSPKSTGTYIYDFVFTTTASGSLTVDGLQNVENVWVGANEKFTQRTELHKGSNYFGITFTPAPDFIPEDGDFLTSYEPYYFEHVVSYQGIGKEGESIWVSPTGDANGEGTEGSPVDIYTAVKYVQPGQQIILKGGTYLLDKTVNTERGNNGYPDKMIYMIADPNAEERPVFDFQWSCPGMVLAGDYWYFKGFDVTHSADAQKGVQVSGSN